MTAKFEIIGDKTKVTFTYEAPTTKVVETVKACVKGILTNDSLVNRQQPPNMEDYTNQQILDYLYKFILDMVIQRARQQLNQDLTSEAMVDVRANIELELKDKLIPDQP